MNNQNSNIYSNYQSNNLNESRNQVNNYNQVNQSNNLNNNQPKGKRILKIIMMVSLILIIISIGGFALVYTGVLKIGYVKPESILLNTSNVGVKKGKEYQYDYQIYPEKSTSRNVYYESSDPSIAQINSLTGYVTPLKEGTVNITIKSQEDEQIIESSTLTVTNKKVPITDIKLSSERIVFDLSNKNTSQLLKVTTEPYNATDQKLQFYSSDEDVAIVDSLGRVFPVGFGMATITVRTKDGIASSSVEVIVTDSKNKKVYFELPDKKKLVFPYEIQLDYNYLKLKYGETRKVGFTLLPPDVTEDVVTWISSNPNVATVKDGLISGIAIGQATITARTVNDLVATLSVEVTDEEVAPSEVQFNNNLENLEVGESKVLSPKYDQEATTSEVTWSTTDSEVVSVDNDGNITAVGSGEAEIIVTTKDGEETAQKVIVEERDETKLLSPLESSITLKVSESVDLQIESDSNYTNYIYKSSNENIVTVNERGVLYGVATGNATVTATTTNGLTAKINVKVIDVPVTNLIISSTTDTIKVGETLELDCEIFPINSTNQNIEWQSSNPEILTVDNGDVKGIAVGSATITVKTGNLYNEFSINVVNKTENVETTEDVIYKNLSLNESSKLKLKQLLLDYERIDEKNIRFYLDIEKYGFIDFVDIEKTTFEIIKQDDTLKNSKVTKMTSPLEFNYEYTGYGTFIVKTILTLKTGETIELDNSKITIYELPENGIQPVLITKENVVEEDIITTASIKVKKGEEGQVSFTKYQEYAEKITNWKSSNSNIATTGSNLKVFAIDSGSAEITGNYKNYKFSIDVIVSDKNILMKKQVDKSFEYGKCYSLCSDSELKNRTNISKNISKCGSSKPYYISEANHKYYYTCTSGNVETTYSGVSTGKVAVKDSKLKINYANGSFIKKGESLNITILNWDELSLESVNVKNSINSSNTTYRGSSFKALTIPKSTNLKTGTISFSAKDKNGKTYNTTLSFNIQEENNSISNISCQKSIILDYNSTATIACTGYDADGKQVALKNITYKSNDTKLVTVNNNGEVKSNKKSGNTTITVTALDKTFTVKVSVSHQIQYTSIKLNPKSTTILTDSKEKSISIPYIVTDENGKTYSNIKEVFFTSSDPNIAIVSPNGIVTRASEYGGIVTITATLSGNNVKDGKISTSVTINVNSAVATEISEIKCNDAKVYVGNTVGLYCYYSFEGDDYQYGLSGSGISYKVKNTEMISIDSSGKVKGLKAGNTSVEVTYKGSKGIAKVNVINNVTGLEISTNTPNIFYGNSSSISYNIKYNKSQNTTSGYNIKYSIIRGADLISIDNNRVKALNNKRGTVDIQGMITLSDGSVIKSNILTLEVNNPNKLEPKELKCSDLTLYEGESGSISCFLYYENSSIVKKITSSEASFTPTTDVEANRIFSSRSGNNLTAKTLSTKSDDSVYFKITLKEQNYITTTSRVVVKKVTIQNISCNESNLGLLRGTKKNLTCKAISNLGKESDAKLKYEIGDKKIATISKNGEIEAKGVGNTTIKVYLADNKNIVKTIPITVRDIYRDFKIILDKDTLGLGESTNISYSAVNSSGKVITSGLDVTYQITGGSGVSVLGTNKPEINVSKDAKIGNYTIKANLNNSNASPITTVKTIKVVQNTKPTSIKCDNINIYVDKTKSISCKIYYSNTDYVYATTSNAKFKITDGGGFLGLRKRISLNGSTVKGESTGPGKIKVTSKDNSDISAIVNVNVLGEVVYDKLKITPAKTILRTGESTTIKCTLHDNETNSTIDCGTSVTYKINDSKATVDKNGNVKAGSKTGSVNITASSKKSLLSDVVSITIRDIVYNSGQLSLTQPSLNVGQKATVKYVLKDTKTNKSSNNVSNVNITSSNPTIATISGNTITAKSAGTTTIRLSYNGNVFDSENLTVKNDIVYDKVIITSLTTSLYVNDKTTIGYQLKDSKSGKTKSVIGAKITSSNSSVATINGTTITAKKVGTATITVKYDGKSVSKTITVKAKPQATKKVTCYSYYNTKTTYSCSSGYSLVGSKCYKIVNAKNKNYCLYVGGNSKKGFIANRTWNGNCLNTRRTASRLKTTKRTGSLQWTSSKSTAQSKSYVGSKQCNNSCNSKNCS